MTDDATLVLATRAGERAAFATLVDRWFDRCWEVAWRILHDRDLAADVAQDTLLVAWRRLAELDRPASFGGWVLRISRNRALDRLERERRVRPTADHAQLEPDMRTHGDAGPEAALARGQQRDMVWAAAAALGERDASMLDLHLRHGLEPAELADELGIAPNAAHQALFRLRQRLGAAIRAWLLWRNADPTCVVLRAELAAAGDVAFGPATVRVVRRHVAACAACEDEQSRVAAPAMLFSVVPLVAAPTAARAHALQQLGAAGVPVRDAAPGGDASGGPEDDAAGGGQGGASWPAAAGSRRVVVLALTLALVLSAGGWAWSRSRTPAQAPPATDAVTAPAAAPGVSESSVPSSEPSSSGDGDAQGADADGGARMPSPAPPPTVPDHAPSEAAPSEPRPVEQAPQIGLLRVLHAGECGDGDPQVELIWESEGGDAATLSGPSGTEPVPLSGVAIRCAPDGTPFGLTVTGPGGEASATVTATAPRGPERDGEQPDEPQ